MQRVLRNGQRVQVRDLGSLLEILLHGRHEPVLNRVNERQMAGPAGAGIYDIRLAVVLKHLRVDRRNFIAVVDEVFPLETEIHDL